MAEMYLEMIKIFFILGGLLAFVIGLILFIKPDRIASWSRIGNKWFSSSKWTKPLDAVHETDLFYFKNHLSVGVSMVILSLVGLFLVMTRMPNADEVLASTSSMEIGMSLGVLLESLKWFIVVTIILGLPMWGVLAFNPDKLRRINKSLNRWVSAGLILLPLEKMNDGFDTFVLHYHRFFGTIFVLGGAFILFKFLG